MTRPRTRFSRAERRGIEPCTCTPTPGRLYVSGSLFPEAAGVTPIVRRRPRTSARNPKRTTNGQTETDLFRLFRRARGTRPAGLPYRRNPVRGRPLRVRQISRNPQGGAAESRSEEHTSELQSPLNLVCR